MSNGPQGGGSTSLDRRIRTVLTRLAGATGGEAVAALAALERLLPPGQSLADVLYVGMHHMRQDLEDASLAAEVRALQRRTEEAERREERARRRAEALERALGETLRDLEAARRAAR
ncbi:hypothetical protein [Arenibaculum pallidiluteum]|uniref:hypothetical protein n=1 Tax=Arenibaculum pallidiluteum TaxID=2812559 RepID=UPI001A97A7E8|nr:hypothetical protein [Arenibaculum pallidiluteum]